MYALDDAWWTRFWLGPNEIASNNFDSDPEVISLRKTSWSGLGISDSLGCYQLLMEFNENTFPERWSVRRQEGQGIDT